MLNLRDQTKKLGFNSYVGITSGVVFCGLIGTIVRREYTVLGDAVNLAARLMVAARQNQKGVLCDFSTAQMAENDPRICLEHLDPIYVKGKKQQIAVACPSLKEFKIESLFPEPVSV